jgi:SnoaL-like protein
MSGDAGAAAAVARLVDHAAVVQTIVGLANALDRKDWARVRASLAPELDVDYMDFRGEPAARVRADAYVAAREAALSPLLTLHISTNHEVEVRGDVASCWSAYRIYRRDPSAAAPAGRLDTAGHYEHRLVRVGDRWLVTAIRQTVVVQDGNRAIHRGVGAGAAGAPTRGPE